MSFQNGYGLVDRALHRLAFAAPTALLGMADLEERLFAEVLAGIEAKAPLFVTGLPRAGTTILLELLARCEEIATHTYRDLPFVLCPLLWSRFSRRFQKHDRPRERAHGDGIEISLDSPEAFEEMVWKAFHRERYLGATIRPWQVIDNREFVAFLRAHMRKVVALRRRERPLARRYASKNNLNIARLPALLDAFDDAVAVVPFREPLQHATSLLRQHRRFLQLHRDDRFARRYMEGIGHHDFGDHLKPIDFTGEQAGFALAAADSLAFWLDYWVRSYRHLLAIEHERFVLLGFEALGAARTLRPLAEGIGIAADELDRHIDLLRPAPAHAVAAEHLPRTLVDEARALHEQLSRRCVLQCVNA